MHVHLQVCQRVGRCEQKLSTECCRSKFLTPSTIGIVPHGGYNKKDKQSLVALKWLKYLAHHNNIDIQHARNGGEVHIGRYQVDGQKRDEPSVVYEFYGCVSYLGL